jgi:hypothetical protein
LCRMRDFNPVIVKAIWVALVRIIFQNVTPTEGRLIVVSGTHPCEDAWCVFHGQLARCHLPIDSSVRFTREALIKVSSCCGGIFYVWFLSNGELPITCNSIPRASQRQRILHALSFHIPQANSAEHWIKAIRGCAAHTSSQLL